MPACRPAPWPHDNLALIATESAANYLAGRKCPAGTADAPVPHVQTASLVSTVVGLVAGAYLMYRACAVVLRVHRARRAYPAPLADARPTEWQQRCRGALLGHAIGDAVNLPAESLPRWLTRLRYPTGPAMRRGLVRFPRRPGDVSDNTQLTIAVARSIRDDGTYSETQFLSELAAWSGFRVGAGRASSRAAARTRRGQAPRGLPSEGNGVAIRIVPFAIAHASCTDQALASVVAANGRVTHTSDASIQAAVFVALLTRGALTQPPRAFAEFSVLVGAVRAARLRSGFQFETPALARIDTDEALAAILQRTGTSGHVHQCVPAAVAVLLRHGLNYEAAMHSIFRAGGDTDSIGAIVGGIIGAQLGAAELPPCWSRDVQHRDYLCVLADRLAQSSTTKSTF